MVGKASSEGTKVNPGENAPVVREGAGTVASESLAAQSVREGGEFASNRNIHEVTGNGAGVTSQQHSSTGASGEPQGQPAPGYVSSQYIREPGGPHGKNITEDPEMIGRPGKLNVKPGSLQDPGRVAEHQMRLKQARVPGAVERQDRAEQPYGVLDDETSA